MSHDDATFVVTPPPTSPNSVPPLSGFNSGDFSQWSKSNLLSLDCLERSNLIRDLPKALEEEDDLEQIASTILPGVATLAMESLDAALAVAESLPAILMSVGGYDHISVIIPLIGDLAAFPDEHFVLPQLARSFRVLCRGGDASGRRFQIPTKRQHLHIRGVLGGYLLNTCAKSRWPSLRAVAAAGLHEVILGTCDDSQPLFSPIEQAVLTSLLHDSDISVRRIVFKAMGQLAESCSTSDVKEWIIPELKAALHDEYHDTLRIIAVGQLCTVLKSLPLAAATEHVFPILTEAFCDLSWRVRYESVSHIDELCAYNAVAAEQFRDVVLKSCEDEEPEVRAIAAKHLHSIAKHLPSKAVMSAVFPVAKKIAEEEDSELVLEGIAHSLFGLCTCVPKADIQAVLHCALGLISRENTSNSVQQISVEKMEVLGCLMQTPSVAGEVVETLISGVKSPRWRVRRSILGVLGHLAECIPERIFLDKLFCGCRDLVFDEVAAVRHSAIDTLRHLCLVLGNGFANETLRSFVESIDGCMLVSPAPLPPPAKSPAAAFPSAPAEVGPVPMKLGLAMSSRSEDDSSQGKEEEEGLDATTKDFCSPKKEDGNPLKLEIISPQSSGEQSPAPHPTTEWEIKWRSFRTRQTTVECIDVLLENMTKIDPAVATPVRHFMLRCARDEVVNVRITVSKCASKWVSCGSPSTSVGRDRSVSARVASHIFPKNLEWCSSRNSPKSVIGFVAGLRSEIVDILKWDKEELIRVLLQGPKVNEVVMTTPVQRANSGPGTPLLGGPHAGPL